MRIYGEFDDVEEDCALFRISSKPFENGCYYLEFKEGKWYDCYRYDGEDPLEDWVPYNCEVCLGEFLYNPKIDNYINSKIVDYIYTDIEEYVELEDGRKIYADDSYHETFSGYEMGHFVYQKYREGKPVGEPYVR